MFSSVFSGHLGAWSGVEAGDGLPMEVIRMRCAPLLILRRRLSAWAARAGIKAWAAAQERFEAVFGRKARPICARCCATSRPAISAPRCRQRSDRDT